ncbi:MAG TPA: hypothetical protein VM074_10475 [Solimonas sp.]|nr:hypothetical protein [Solimonas sp.]
MNTMKCACLALLTLALAGCAGMAPQQGGSYGPSQSVGPGGVQQSAGPWGPSQSVGPGGVQQSSGPYGPSQSAGPGGVQQSSGPYGPSQSAGPGGDQQSAGGPRGGSSQNPRPATSCRAQCPDESASVECPAGKLAACQCQSKPYAMCRTPPPPKK